MVIVHYFILVITITNCMTETRLSDVHIELLKDVWTDHSGPSINFGAILLDPHHYLPSNHFKHGDDRVESGLHYPFIE